MAFDPREFRLEILKNLCQTGDNNYKENVRVIALLEDKAQKTAALAGIFLAAALAFIKPDTLTKWPFDRARIWVALSASIILLIVCIAFSVMVLWIRSIVESMPFSSVERFQKGLFAIDPAALEQYEEGYWSDTAAIWRRILDEQRPIMASKGNRLLCAQIALALAMFSVAIALLLIIHLILSALVRGGLSHAT